MATENRDIIIAGGVLVLLGVLYFAVRPKPAIQVAPDSTSATQTSTNGPPSYNMPPILTLPPYNTGNAPVMTLPNSTPPADSCGCSACNGKNAGPVSYGNMTAFWNAPDTGITMPQLMQAPALPSVANTIQTPPAMSFTDWQKAEGLNKANNAMQQAGLENFNPLADRTPLYIQQTTQISGWDILIGNEKLQHKVYAALNGQLYNMATPAQKTAADAIIFA